MKKHSKMKFILVFLTIFYAFGWLCVCCMGDQSGIDDNNSMALFALTVLFIGLAIISGIGAANVKREGNKVISWVLLGKLATVSVTMALILFGASDANVFGGIIFCVVAVLAAAAAVFVMKKNKEIGRPPVLGYTVSSTSEIYQSFPAEHHLKKAEEEYCRAKHKSVLDLTDEDRNKISEYALNPGVMFYLWLAQNKKLIECSFEQTFEATREFLLKKKDGKIWQKDIRPDEQWMWKNYVYKDNYSEGSLYADYFSLWPDSDYFYIHDDVTEKTYKRMKKKITDYFEYVEQETTDESFFSSQYKAKVKMRGEETKIPVFVNKKNISHQYIDKCLKKIEALEENDWREGFARFYFQWDNDSLVPKEFEGMPLEELFANMVFKRVNICEPENPENQKEEAFEIRFAVPEKEKECYGVLWRDGFVVEVDLGAENEGKNPWDSDYGNIIGSQRFMKMFGTVTDYKRADELVAKGALRKEQVLPKKLDFGKETNMFVYWPEYRMRLKRKATSELEALVACGEIIKIHTEVIDSEDNIIRKKIIYSGMDRNNLKRYLFEISE